MTSHNIKLSIIITVYNQQDFLERAIFSCLTQKVEGLEIIVVDDGSIVPIVLPEFTLPESTSLHLLRKENGGVASARNLGLAHAKGAYLKFLDCDDELLPDCCSAQLSSVNVTRAELSIIGYRVTQGDKWVEGISKFDSLLPALLQGNVAPLHSFMYRAEDVHAINGFDQTDRTLLAMEDYDFNLRLALRGIKAITVHQVGVLYHRQGVSRSSDTRKVHQANVRILLYAIESILTAEIIQACLLDVLQGIAQLAVQSQDFKSFLEILPKLKDLKVGSSALMAAKFELQVESRLTSAKNTDEQQFWRLQSELLSLAELNTAESLCQPGYAYRPASPPLAAHYFDGVLLAAALAQAIESKGLWLWGKGVWADYWLSMLNSFGIQPLGFIDSYAEDGDEYNNLPCMKLSRIPEHRLHNVIICSRDSYFTIRQLLAEQKLEKIILHYVTI